MASLIEGINKLLRYQPVIEHRYCELSKQYGWLMHIGLKAIEKLIANKHPAVFTSASLFILTQAPTFIQYESFRSWAPSHNIPTLIVERPKLNHALFWNDVEETRSHFARYEREPLTYFWQVSVFEGYWKFTVNDFQLIVADISNRPLLADQLVALSLAFKLYQENGHPADWLDVLKDAVANENELKKRLDEMLYPPAPSEQIKKWKKEETQWKRQEKEREKKRQQAHADDVKWFNDNYEKLRFNGLAKGAISQAQYSAG